MTEPNTAPYEAPEELIDLVNHLVDLAIVPHSNGDETFQECRLCGRWEEHADECPVPALERWMNTKGN